MAARELCGRAEWTMDRVAARGFQDLLAAQEQYMEDFWRRSDVRVRDVRAERTKRTTVEIQQAIRFNLFQVLQASARTEDAGVPAKASPDKRMRALFLGYRDLPAAVPNLYVASYC